MNIKEITSLEDFHNMAKSYDDTHPVFRGVRNSSFKLLTRVGRSMLLNQK